MRAASNPSVRTLLVLLLVADLALILLHLANRRLNLSDQLSLDVDHSYSEFLQYVKYLWLIVLSAWAGIKCRRWRLAGWSAVFGYLLLDDALQIHERLGRGITDALSPGSHQPDATLGEVLGTAGPMLLCVVLAWFLHREPVRAHRIGQRAVIVLLATLALFGVAIDMLHGMLASGPSQPGDLLTVIEDGGELVAVSVLVALFFGWVAFRERGLRDEPGPAYAEGRSPGADDESPDALLASSTQGGADRAAEPGIRSRGGVH